MQYSLPTNAMLWRTQPEIATRREISNYSLSETYLPLEGLLEDYGFSGRECVLKMICESAQANFKHDEMGLLEEIVHAVLT